MEQELCYCVGSQNHASIDNFQNYVSSTDIFPGMVPRLYDIMIPLGC